MDIKKTFKSLVSTALAVSTLTICPGVLASNDGRKNEFSSGLLIGAGIGVLGTTAVALIVNALKDNFCVKERKFKDIDEFAHYLRELERKLCDDCHARYKIHFVSSNECTFSYDTGTTTCGFIERIYFERGVTSIPNCAFKDCCHLESIELPEGVKSIGNRAFWSCISLSDIKLPNSVETVGREAFPWSDIESHDFRLKEIALPENLKSIHVSSLYYRHAICYRNKTCIIPTYHYDDRPLAEPECEFSRKAHDELKKLFDGSGVALIDDIPAVSAHAQN